MVKPSIASRIGLPGEGGGCEGAGAAVASGAGFAGPACDAGPGFDVISMTG
jgi:hypothetical protein